MNFRYILIQVSKEDLFFSLYRPFPHTRPRKSFRMLVLIYTVLHICKWHSGKVYIFEKCISGRVSLTYNSSALSWFLVQGIISKTNKEKQTHTHTFYFASKCLHFKNFLSIPLSQINELIIPGKLRLNYKMCNWKRKMIVDLCKMTFSCCNIHLTQHNITSAWLLL